MTGRPPVSSGTLVCWSADHAVHRHQRPSDTPAPSPGNTHTHTHTGLIHQKTAPSPRCGGVSMSGPGEMLQPIKHRPSFLTCQSQKNKCCHLFTLPQAHKLTAMWQNTQWHCSQVPHGQNKHGLFTWSNPFIWRTWEHLCHVIKNRWLERWQNTEQTTTKHHRMFKDLQPHMRAQSGLQRRRFLLLCSVWSWIYPSCRRTWNTDFQPPFPFFKTQKRGEAFLLLHRFCPLPLEGQQAPGDFGVSLNFCSPLLNNAAEQLVSCIPWEMKINRKVNYDKAQCVFVHCRKGKSALFHCMYNNHNVLRLLNIQKMLLAWSHWAVKSAPQQYVDFRKAFPLLPALRALVLVRRFPPQSQTVAAKVMAACQGGGVYQDVIAAVTGELVFRDTGPGGSRIGRFRLGGWQ